MNEEETEIWRDVVGYEGLYKVSNLGNVKNCLSGRILKLCNDKDGYKIINLYKNGVRKTYGVHRLVSKAFLTNPNNLPQVNHKDEDKTNNRVDNLEWCDAKYNLNFGTAQERKAKKISKSIVQFNKNGNFINEYQSAREAERKTGINQGNICRVCQGERKSAGGYVWKYKNDYFFQILAENNSLWYEI